MFDPGNRSTNRFLIDKFACSYFLWWTSVSLYLQMRHIQNKKMKRKYSSNGNNIFMPSTLQHLQNASISFNLGHA